MSFGLKLKELRKNKGLTQKQLAEMIGAKHTSVSNWENGQNYPDVETIELLCGALDISPNQLLSETKKSPAPAEAETEDELLIDLFYNLAVKAGFIREGDELTDMQEDGIVALIKLVKIIFTSQQDRLIG